MSYNNNSMTRYIQAIVPTIKTPIDFAVQLHAALRKRCQTRCAREQRKEETKPKYFIEVSGDMDINDCQPDLLDALSRLVFESQLPDLLLMFPFREIMQKIILSPAGCFMYAMTKVSHAKNAKGALNKTLQMSYTTASDAIKSAFYRFVKSFITNMAHVVPPNDPFDKILDR